MACLPFRQEMKATFLPPWLNKVPSPSGSDDSGIGLSPSPTNSDRHFHLDSPGRHYVVKGFVEGFAEDASTPAYNYDETKCYFSQLKSSDIKSNIEVDRQLFDQPKSFLPDIQRKYIGEPIKTFSNIQQKKSWSKPKIRKKTSTVTENLASSKLDRCLQPKTGNGKPRQTSTKKKMSQKLNGTKSNPGVRVNKTVRERLRDLRGEERSMQENISPKVNQHRHSPYCGPQLSLPPNLGDFRGPRMANPCFPSPNLLPDGRNDSANLTNAPEATLHQISLASSVHSSCETHISNACSSFGNVMSPPNITLSTSMQQLQVAPDSNYTMETSLPSQSSCFVTQQSNVYLNNQPSMSTTYLNQSQLEPSCALKAMPGSSYQNLLSCDHSFVGNYRVPSQSDHSHPVYQATTSSVQTQGYDQDYPQIHLIAAASDTRTSQDRLVMKRDSSRSKDTSGLLPIFYAIRNNQVDAVKILLNESSPTFICPDGMTVLHEAARLPNPYVLEFLLSSLSEWNKQELINRKTIAFGGLTPLHVATEAGSVENMGLLLKHGADISVQTDQSWMSSLHIAAKNADCAAVRALVEFSKIGHRKFDIDLAMAKQEKKATIKEKPMPLMICQKDRNGNSPLHLVTDLQRTHGCDGLIVQLQENLVCYLLDNGADPSALNAEYKTPSQLLPAIGSFPRSRELYSLLGNVSPNVTDGSLESSSDSFIPTFPSWTSTVDSSIGATVGNDHVDQRIHSLNDFCCADIEN